jgi:hypothetical protein
VVFGEAKSLFASDSILTGGSMNYVAATIYYTNEAATCFKYLKRNLMPNI